MGRKKRIGFADLQATQAELAGGEGPCPECKRKLSEADGLRFVQGFGQAAGSLAALNCPRCRTIVSLRIITPTEANSSSALTTDEIASWLQLSQAPDTREP